MRYGVYGVWCLVAVLGCSNDSDAPEPDGDEAAEVEDVTVEGPQADAMLADLDPEMEVPARGFQTEVEGLVLKAGTEGEWCEVVQIPQDVPGSVYNRVEWVQTPYFHHLFVSSVIPGSRSDELTEPGMRERCSIGPHTVFGVDLEPIPYVASIGEYANADFPEGTGFTLEPGTKLVINYHYVNISAEDIPVKTWLNFHLADEADLRPVQIWGMYNNVIEVPPGSSSSTSMEHAFTQDAYIPFMARHTHDLGTEFNVWMYGGERDGELVYTSPDNDTVPFKEFDPPLHIRAGEGFRFECNYYNPGDTTVDFGPTAEDEMCFLVGIWWPVDPSIEPENQNFYRLQE